MTPPSDRNADTRSATTMLRGTLHWLRIMLMLVLAAVGLTAQARAAPTTRYAAFMIDANTREVLYANSPDEPHHPASLTKMMTLYLLFDALEAGKIGINDPIPVSAHAASQQPSRLGLAIGQSISVDNAISVVAVKSANDIAVAIAEKLGGSEGNFVNLMNSKAAQLGMRNTHFANASGLTNASNITTARDLTILSLALVRDHPRYYRYFGERDFTWQHSNLINHNHLLGKMAGLDGIKTGYTVDSGFTLAASAIRGNRRLIAVVLGEPSIVSRNRDASALLEAGFSVMDRRLLGQSVTVASMLPTMDHPALRIEPATEQGASDDAQAAPPPPRRVARGHAAPSRHHHAAHSSTSSRTKHGKSTTSTKTGKKSGHKTETKHSASSKHSGKTKSSHKHKG